MSLPYSEEDQAELDQLAERMSAWQRRGKDGTATPSASYGAAKTTSKKSDQGAAAPQVSLSAAEPITSDFPHQRSELPRLRGLSNRLAPLDDGLLPKVLIALASACRGRSAAYAPNIYALPHREGMTFVSEGQTTRDLRQSKMRYRLCQKREHSDGTSVTNELPSPYALWVLSHLVILLKYRCDWSEITEHHAFEKRCEMHIQPAPLIERTGYRICGERYQRMESALAMLAELMICVETRNAAGEWHAVSHEPLLLSLDTGRVSISNGQRQATTPQARRHDRWRVGLSKPLMQLLDGAAADLTVIPRTLWQTAGRSKLGQALMLHVAQHGFDHNDIRGIRLDTLSQRFGLIDGQRDLFDVDAMGELDPSDISAPRPKAEIKHTVSINREGTRAIRRAVRHTASVISRIADRCGLAEIGIQSTRSPSDLRPSQIRRGQHSRADLLMVRRHVAPIEALIAQLPSAIKRRASATLKSASQVIAHLRKEKPAGAQFLEQTIALMNCASLTKQRVALDLLRRATNLKQIAERLTSATFQLIPRHNASPHPFPLI